MRVAQGEAVDLATLLQQQAVGPRRQGDDPGRVGDRLDQQGTVRGAVEDAEVALLVQGDEALAPLFRSDGADRRAIQIEVANVRQARFAVGIASHEPLGDATLGVAHQQRDAAQQLGARGDLGVGVFQQLVATVQLAAVQVEHIGGGTSVDHVQPLLARVEVDGFHRFGDLREFDALLVQRAFAGQHVLFPSHAQQQQLLVDGASQQQAVVAGIDAHMLQRAALQIETDRGLAVGEGDLRGDGLLVVRVGDLVGVLEHQHLSVGQAQGDRRAARLVLGDRADLAARRKRQSDTLQFDTGLGVEEENLALAADAHGHLVLLLDAEQQGHLRLLHPGRSQRFAGLQVGAAEQGEHDVGQVEEDQGDRRQHGQAADQHVPAGQAVLEGTDAALALQGWRIEVNPLGSKGGVHRGVGHVVHGVTP